MNTRMIITGLFVGSLLLTSCANSQQPAATATPEAVATTDTATETVTTTDVTTDSITTTAAITPTTGATMTAATIAEDATPAIVAAANDFLATLNDSEQEAVLFDWTDTAQKQRWSNFPPAGFERDGLMWGDMSEEAQNAWLAVLQVTLSTEGYNRFLAEWQADDALLAEEGTGGGFGTANYYIAIIGAPSETEPWQWQFGGHHVTLNATIVNSQAVLTPSFIGCQPCTYTGVNGDTVRPLGNIEDEGFALINSLDATQQNAAVLGDTPIGLILGPGEDGRTIASEGLLASQMTAEQQTAFLHLVGHYTGLVNDEDAAVRMAEIESELDETYFAWYGPTEPGSVAYFRVTGPSIVIEFAPQGSGRGGGGGGATDNHIHGIYRDPTNDYGAEYTGIEIGS